MIAEILKVKKRRLTKILNLTGLDVETMSSLHRQSSVRA